MSPRSKEPLATRPASTSSTVSPRAATGVAIDPVAFKKTKHILRAAEGLRDLSAREVIKMTFLAGSINLADIGTKAQAVSVFLALMAAYDNFTSHVAPSATSSTASG